MDILWIENHHRFSQIAAAQFLAAHSLTIVPTLVAARHALSANRFDVVLVDYDLDDGKGTDIVAEIKRQSDPPMIIATSSHANGNQKLVAAGAEAICSKLEFSNIENVLRRVCKQHA
jgi:DNA-binding response OmpR family regulator